MNATFCSSSDEDQSDAIHWVTLGYIGLLGDLLGKWGGEKSSPRKHETEKVVFNLLLFIIRVNRELKRVYRNGCRYNERLNAETGGSKTPCIHWIARVNIQ